MFQCDPYQIPDFVSAKADFGTDLAISTRMELDPGKQLRCYATWVYIKIHTFDCLYYYAKSRGDMNVRYYYFLLAAWWQQHGISCLELQRIAIRILSQTCSSLGCEHTWSTYDQVHSKRLNCLSRKRWNELTYVHYNLRLRERQLGRKHGDLISFDGFMIESILDDWLVETEKQAMQEDEVPQFLHPF